MKDFRIHPPINRCRRKTHGIEKRKATRRVDGLTTSRISPSVLQEIPQAGQSAAQDLSGGGFRKKTCLVNVLLNLKICQFRWRYPLIRHNQEISPLQSTNQPEEGPSMKPTPLRRPRAASAAQAKKLRHFFELSW